MRIHLFFLSTILLAALPSAACAQSDLTPDRVVPNHLIVSFGDGTAPSVDLLPAQLPGASLLAWYPHLRVAILQLADPIDIQVATRQLLREPEVSSVTEDRIVSAHTLAVRISPHPVDTPDALYASSQGWAVRAVGGFGVAGGGFGPSAGGLESSAAGSSAPGPWNRTEGAGVRIAILDSGTDASHPDLAPNLGLNLTEIDQSPLTGLASSCDDGSPQDQQGHGTWTASLAAGALGPGTGLIAGVAPAATLLNIKVLERLPTSTLSPSDPTGCSAGQAGGLLSWVIHGIEDAISAHAGIVSMSFGVLVDSASADGVQASILLNQIAHVATQAGVLLIASAGNDGLELGNGRFVELPAEATGVLAIVASTNPACAENLAQGASCAPGPVTLPYYSNFGAPLNALAAPGGSYPARPDAPSAISPDAASGWITGACSSGKSGTFSGPPTDPAHSFGCFGLGHAAYVQAMGTSAAAPLAAGAAALLRAVHPDWTPATVIQALRSSAALSSPRLSPQINVTSLLVSGNPEAR